MTEQAERRRFIEVGRGAVKGGRRRPRVQYAIEIDPESDAGKLTVSEVLSFNQALGEFISGFTRRFEDRVRTQEKILGRYNPQTSDPPINPSA